MATKWNLDPTHSEVTFKVKHMMISNVKGQFKTFNAEIDADDDNFNNAKVTATIDVNSIFTNNTDRDNHLKSAILQRRSKSYDYVCIFFFKQRS